MLDAVRHWCFRLQPSHASRGRSQPMWAWQSILDRAGDVGHVSIASPQRYRTHCQLPHQSRRAGLSMLCFKTYSVKVQISHLKTRAGKGMLAEFDQCALPLAWVWYAFALYDS
eukprot:5626507-Amphidinium_carterae.1